ncbi:zinc transporter ZntB [Sneathiella aquimaris]|uniref:zinc transporter ZntB n=1 Tax=Sneathiella aquimaris TaxID=2599305 RepID=UPI00146A2428|nr:zinc transporter ZntB [Sneathiella aquimaris]
MNSPILLACDFNGEGGGQALNETEATQQLKADQLAWVHLDVNHPQTRGWLEKEVSYLDDFIIEALMAWETRPRIMEIGDGVLIILRGVNLNENASPEDMISIRLWVDRHRIISLQKRQLKAVFDIHDRINAGKGPKDCAEFICLLISRLFDRMEPVLTELDERTDTVEEKVLDEPDLSLRNEIVNIRKQAIILRRYMAPQKDAIGQLRNSSLEWFEITDKRNLLESYDRILRYVEDLDAIRERAQIVKDELVNTLSDRLNKNMYVLSVIAAIFLPLGFLTGLLGINVGGIPGTDYKYAFWLFSGLLIGVVGIQIYAFKRLKWF